MALLDAAFKSVNGNKSEEIHLDDEAAKQLVAEFLKEIRVNIITKLGLFLEKRFPEKMTAEDVMTKLKAIDSDITMLHQAVEALEMRLQAEGKAITDIEKLKSDVQKLQSLAVIKSRIAPSYGGNMNPVMGPVSK